MSNTSKRTKQSTTSKCELCGKEHDTKWMYCSDDCYTKARKRARAENELLHLRVENAQLEKHAFACELEAEGFRPAPNWNPSDLLLKID